MMNWRSLADAIDFYTARGFTYMDVPWLTTYELMNVTKPVEKLNDRTYILESGLEMIASAEQGFITLLHEGLMPPGRFISCSPCFRNEPKFDEIHHPYFMKVELYSSNVSPEELEYIISTSEQWFRTFGLDTTRVQIDNNQIDLEAKHIELGSYGIRNTHGYHFIYGTGHAEPRASYVKSLK